MKSGLGFICGIAICLFCLSSLTKTSNSQLIVPATPVGLVMAFPGDKNKIPGDGKWLLCEGQSKKIADYQELFQVIGWTYGLGADSSGNRTTFQLPDYRGYFLRGVSGKNDEGKNDNRDPEVDKRRASDGTNASGGKSIGTIQDDSTRLPRYPNEFKTDKSGIHSHLDPTFSGYPGPHEVAVDGRGPAGIDYNSSASTNDSGEHFHKVVGGDKETRPKNVYVYWIIKAKP